MAKNQLFREGTSLSMPVPVGTLAGSPVRVGALNAVTVTDEGSVVSTIQLGLGASLSYPSGGVGDGVGFASCSLEGAYNLNVVAAGAAGYGAPVYINGDNSLSLTSTAALAAPVLSAGTTATTGGTLAAGVYKYQATYTNSFGQSVGSNEVSITTTGATSTASFTIGAAPAGASGMKIYRTAVNGATGSELLLDTVATATSYTDTGSKVLGTAKVPTSDSSGSHSFGALIGTIAAAGTVSIPVLLAQDVTA